MQQGTVNWFSSEKGYGFISSEGKEYFVHFREIQTPGFKTLKDGDAVTFEPSTSLKGLVATNVSVGV